jgi:hypothetical protein
MSLFGESVVNKKGMSTTRRGFFASLRGLLPMAAVAAVGAEVAPKAKADASLIVLPLLCCPYCYCCMETGSYTEAARWPVHRS